MRGEQQKVVDDDAADDAGDTHQQDLALEVDISSLGAAAFTSLDVKAEGRHAVLGCRKGFVVLDLRQQCDGQDESVPGQKVLDPARTVYYESKWDVGAVRWSPNAQNSHLFASISHHTVLVWDGSCAGSPDPAGAPLICKLSKHTRAVTGLSWCPGTPSVLATCSADANVHLWDVRAPLAPIQTFRVAHRGAQVVEWNRMNRGLLASAHENELRVWDTRRGGSGSDAVAGASVVALTAHTQQVTCLDWSRLRPYDLVTCSNDRTAKLWGGVGATATSASTPLAILQRQQPLQRVLFTPFGQGVLTTSFGIGELRDAPQTLRLWSLADLENAFVPVKEYVGATQQILSACWRILGDGNLQVASLDKRQRLRLHSVAPSHLSACGYGEMDAMFPVEVEVGSEAPRSTTQRSKITLSSLRSDLVPLATGSRAAGAGGAGGRSNGIWSLWREVAEVEAAVVGRMLPDLKVEGVDMRTRTFRALLKLADSSSSSDMGTNFLAITVAFPQQYPSPESPPSFHMTGEVHGRPITSSVLENFESMALATARRAQQAHAPCLELTLRSLNRALTAHVASLLESAQQKQQQQQDEEAATVMGGSEKARDGNSGTSGGLIAAISISGPGDGAPEASNPNAVANIISNTRNPREAPCPRTFGAAFNAIGRLVVFHSYSTGEAVGVPRRPRTYSELLQIDLGGEQTAATKPPSQQTRKSVSFPHKFAEDANGSSSDSDMDEDDVYDLYSSSSNAPDPQLRQARQPRKGIPPQDDAPATQGGLLQWAQRSNQVVLLDYSAELPGTPALAAPNLLGEWRRRNVAMPNSLLLHDAIMAAKLPPATSRSSFGSYVNEESSQGGGAVPAASSFGSGGVGGLLMVGARKRINRTESFSRGMSSIGGLAIAPGLARQKQWDSVPDFKARLKGGVSGGLGENFGGRYVRAAAEARSPPPFAAEEVISATAALVHHSCSLGDLQKRLKLESETEIGTSATGASLPIAIRAIRRTSSQGSPHVPTGGSRNLGGSSSLDTSINLRTSSTSLTAVGSAISAPPPVLSEFLPVTKQQPLPQVHVEKRQESSAQSASACCRLNAVAAAQAGVNELAKAWVLLAEICDAAVGMTVLPSRPRGQGPCLAWYQRVSGRPLVGRILNHFMAIGDIQTCAVMLCVLGSESTGENLAQLVPIEAEHVERCLNAYADLLYVWGADEARAAVLKHLPSALSPPAAPAKSGAQDLQGKDDDPPRYCVRCALPAEGGICRKCRDLAFRCSVCQLTVRGMSLFCSSCGHGGHVSHISGWFKKNIMCATGCGCECKRVGLPPTASSQLPPL
jgi:hypothetical protein